MTKEDKELLLKDLSARLQYGVVLKTDNVFPQKLEGITFDNGTFRFWISDGGFTLDNMDCIPYLRPMSSMTDEEFGFLQEHLPYDFTRIYSGKVNLIDDIHLGDSISIDDVAFLLDYLNKRHFDYRGLIEKGLAIEAPEGMYTF